MSLTYRLRGFVLVACAAGCAEEDKADTSFGSQTLTAPMITTAPPPVDEEDDESSGDASSTGEDDESTGAAEASSSTGAPSVCGDGELAADELCDDGDADDADECLSTCVPAACGDGVVQEGVEACDDGNADDADGCRADCTPATCGDGVVAAGIEECDDANLVDTDACRNNCKAARCGDGVVQAGEEMCDDANKDELDACSNTCQILIPKPNCREVLAAKPGAASGVYTIDPDGGGGQPGFKAFCDMTTEGGGWTLILNRHVDGDNDGAPDLKNHNGTFDATRANDYNLDIDLFWADAAEFVFADRQNDDCSGCEISGYHSAILVPRPSAQLYSNTCSGASQPVSALKLSGPQAGTSGTAFQCGASLGWGSCGGKNCHFGTHAKNTAADDDFGDNAWQEMHFPSAHSSFAAYGDCDAPPSAWCRGCAGGLAANFNGSSSCCNSQQANARARWTLWVR